MTKSPEKHVAVFIVTAILSWLLLMLFPFYPAQLTIVLAAALGLVGLKSPRIGLMLATLLAMFGALYQGALVGLTFLIILLIASSLDTWDLASIITSCVLVLLTPLPVLAIIPSVTAGLYERPGDALRLGVLSCVTIFLLSWIRGVSQAGLILVSSTSSYVAKNVPSAWYFTLFMPSVDTFTLTNLTNYYGPLLTNLNDYRVYVALIAWSMASYITALLASRKLGYFVSGLIGVLPPAIIGLIIINAPALQVVAVLIVAGILPLGFMPVRSKMAATLKDKKIPVHITTRPTDGRQLAAIMFTDVVGYAILAKDDESAALQLLEAQKKMLQPILEKYKGREIKAIGDTRIVEFTNALDAVNCAVEIQNTLEKDKLTSNGKAMELRIGLHLGDVIHREGDVLGEAVNIASRIEILADPGGICVSRQVYDQVWNEVDYEMTVLAPHELKNVQYPAEIYRISPKKRNPINSNHTGNSGMQERRKN